jgi:hypothetical protein
LDFTRDNDRRQRSPLFYGGISAVTLTLEYQSVTFLMSSSLRP